MSALQENDTAPVLLRGDALTPPSRTPWGGLRIRALKGLGDGPPVGESWELSVDPQLPSLTIDGRSLSAKIDADPIGWLGADRKAALLVKLLDAADELSVQIHPADGYPGLEPGESGKPESWYVVAADPGAGIYLGLTEDADETRLRACLASGADVSKLLPFIPVEPGDFFLIEAGTPHCIGRGVLLVEPQRVEPGRAGVTYRYWDWNRRYDEAGRPDESGRPRALHVEHALAVTRWDRPRGDALLARIRRRVGAPDLGGPPTLDALAGEGGIASDHLAVARLAGSGELTLAGAGRLRALTVLEGAVELGDLRVEAGRTAAVPAAFTGPARLAAAHAILSAAA